MRPKSLRAQGALLQGGLVTHIATARTATMFWLSS